MLKNRYFFIIIIIFFFFEGLLFQENKAWFFLHAFLTSRDSCVQIVLLFVYGKNLDYITNILM